MNPFTGRTIRQGKLHLKLAYNFMNFVNITFVDKKFELCDLFVQLIDESCPIRPGIYHLKYTTTIESLFLTVSNRQCIIISLFFFIGSVLW